MQGTRTAGRSGCGRWGAPREQGGTGWSEPEWTPAPPCLALVGVQGRSGVCASLRTPAVVTARPASPFVGPFDAQESPARHSTKPSRLLPSPAPRNCRPLLDPGPQSGLPQQQSHAGPSPAPAALACPPGLVWGSDHVPSAWPVRGRASHGDHSPARLLSPLPGRPGGRQTPPGPGPLPRQRRARRRRALNASPPQGRAEAASPGAGAAGAPACSRG